MRFLTDQDVLGSTVNLLRDLGHDVVRAEDLGLATADDAEILRRGRDDGGIVVTCDKDFGALVFLLREWSVGVMLLRRGGSSPDDLHRELTRTHELHPEDVLTRHFTTVTPERHRLRKLVHLA